jgi:hypothetical protein
MLTVYTALGVAGMVLDVLLKVGVAIILYYGYLLIKLHYKTDLESRSSLDSAQEVKGVAHPDLTSKSDKGGIR